MNFSDLGKIFSDLKKLSENKEEIKEKLKHTIIEGSSGGDFVIVKANLLGEIVQIIISDELFNMNDKKMLEDLILAAINDVLFRAKKEMVNQSINIPESLKMFFNDNFNL
ncbi:MAG: YbaB/EbfC family nucleoid-associated protein [Spirochaetes bacterium]|nr:YbaB/EbfC family nucleoid-associated protein [Spirochaetota bacterium]